MKLTEGKGRGRGESGGRQALVESQNLEIFICLPISTADFWDVAR